MPFRAVFPAIRGIGASFRPPQIKRSHRTAVHYSLGSVDPVGQAQFVQKYMPDFLPDPRILQFPEPLPPGYAAPQTQFRGRGGGGRNSQAVQVRATNWIPVRANRSGGRGQPHLGRGFSGGTRGFFPINRLEDWAWPSPVLLDRFTKTTASVNSISFARGPNVFMGWEW